ncbi:MAG TPA: F-box-like domain-containing protein, partial [Nitrosopumilaceae archaeon]|nr:F-box-like domain-containing protein [Nitrosopumilaceae archaeon]
MSTNITAAGTQKSPYSPEIHFGGFAIPYEILTQIFSRIVFSKDIHSLLLTNKNINKLILDNNEIWPALLEKHFPGS